MFTVFYTCTCSYPDDLGDGIHKPDIDKYSLFYFLCQAVFNVFIFRHRSILEMEGGRSVVGYNCAGFHLGSGEARECICPILSDSWPP